MRVHASATTWVQRGVLAVLGTTLVVAGLQATGSAVATVQVADGTAWLTNSPRGTLVQVSSASEAATATVDVAAAGDNLVARQDGHSALVLNRSTGEIGKVDGALLRYTPQESCPDRPPTCSSWPAASAPTCSTPARAMCAPTTAATCPW